MGIFDSLATVRPTVPMNEGRLICIISLRALRINNFRYRGYKACKYITESCYTVSIICAEKHMSWGFLIA